MDLKIPQKFFVSGSLPSFTAYVCSLSLPLVLPFTLHLNTSSPLFSLFLSPPHPLSGTRLGLDMQLNYCLAAHIALSLQLAIIGNRSLFIRMHGDTGICLF